MSRDILKRKITAGIVPDKTDGIGDSGRAFYTGSGHRMPEGLNLAEAAIDDRRQLCVCDLLFKPEFCDQWISQIIDLPVVIQLKKRSFVLADQMTGDRDRIAPAIVHIDKFTGITGIINMGIFPVNQYDIVLCCGIAASLIFQIKCSIRYIKHQGGMVSLALYAVSPAAVKMSAVDNIVIIVREGIRWCKEKIF